MRPAPRPQEWIVSFSYVGKKKTERSVDFTVIERTAGQAETAVYRAIDFGIDSNGADISWVTSVPWDEVTTSTPEEAGEENEAPAEALIGYIAIR